MGKLNMSKCKEWLKKAKAKQKKNGTYFDDYFESPVKPKKKIKTLDLTPMIAKDKKAFWERISESVYD